MTVSSMILFVNLVCISVISWASLAETLLGPIVSLVRRSVNFDVRPNSTMTQYAFIGFSNVQDAQNAILTGEVTLDNRKL